MSDTADRADGAGKHQAARLMAERAIAAQAAGDAAEAERLFGEAARIDPQAVAAALEEGVVDQAGGDAGPQDDAEIAAMSRTIEPGSAAPSRAGVSGRGSGADNEAT